MRSEALSERPERSTDSEKPVRVLICEDSKTDREILLRLLLRNEDIEVVAVADKGEDVLPYIERLEPRLVTLDLNLPGRSGIEVIEEIMAKHPLPILVISGQADDSKIAMEALAAGAVEVMSKPRIESEADFESQSLHLAELVRTLSRVKVIRHVRGKLAPRRTGLGDRVPEVDFGTDKARLSSIEIGTSAPKKIVGLAASTGGPQALKAVLSEFGGDFPAPVLVVQHIAKGFTAGFVEWLSGGAGLEVKLAEDGEPLRDGVVYVGPENSHILVRKGRIALEPPEPGDKHCPSADKLFASMAEDVGNRAVCVILTGMGNDGAAGASVARAKGATVIVQDESSSIVFGMPKAAVDAGAAGAVVPLDRLAAEVIRAVQGNSSLSSSKSR